MTEIMNELYYMVEERIGQGLLDDEEVRSLEEQKSALEEQLIHRLGEDGEGLLEAIKNLELELETIYDEALFRAAVRLGAELTRPEAGAGATAAGA